MQHLSSKKHLDKVSGNPKKPPAAVRVIGGGGARNWKGAFYGRGGTRGGSALSRKWDPSAVAPSPKWDPVATAPIPTYSHSAEYTDSGYTDESYGLSSLTRGAASDYGARGRANGSARPAAARPGATRAPYARSDPYSMPRARATVGLDYSGGGGGEETAYDLPTAAYGAEYDHGHGYASGQAIGHPAGRSMPFTYTQPLSQNFVSGGSIL